MTLTDDEGGKWELNKCPESPAPRWLWRDLAVGVLIALAIATQMI